nr:hypothetical protein [Pantoea cypripedii]
MRKHIKNEMKVQFNNQLTLLDGKTWHQDKNAVFRCAAYVCAQQILRRRQFTAA